jgi:molecular chaperone DnaK
VYQVEKLLGENRGKLSDDDIAKVEGALEQCKRALADGGAECIRSALQALGKTTQEVAEALQRTGAVPT